MDNLLEYKELCNDRRDFLKKLSLGAAGVTLGSLGMVGCASNGRNLSTLRRKSAKPDERTGDHYPPHFR